MLSATIQAALQEIAYEGSPGISWPGLTTRLASRGLVVDVDVRRELWSHLTTRCHGVVLRDPAGNELSRGRPLPEPADARGSKKRRKEAQRCLLDVSQTIRAHALLTTAHPELVVGDGPFRALQVIARHRYEGCWASILAMELGVSSRDLFYQIEGLRLASLAFSVHGIMPKHELARYHKLGGKASVLSVHSNVYFHAAFFDPEAVEANQTSVLLDLESSSLAERMMKTLRGSRHGVLFESDLRAFATQAVERHRLLGAVRAGRVASKLYHRVRQLLVDQREIEIVSVFCRVSKAFRPAVCLFDAHPDPGTGVEAQLALEDATPAVRPATGEQERREPDGEQAGDCLDAGLDMLLVGEQGIFQQAVDLVRAACDSDVDEDQGAGLAGLKGPEVSDLLGLRRKAGERILNDIVRTGEVLRVLESDGRKHVNRYVVAAAAAPKGGAAKARAPESRTVKEESGLVGSSVEGMRFDSTFERRLRGARDVLEEQGLLTLRSLQRAAARDPRLRNSGTAMDRRSSRKILEVLLDFDGRAQASRGEDGVLKFLFWSPAISLEEAERRVRATTERDRARKALQVKANRSTRSLAEPRMSITDDREAAAVAAEGVEAPAFTKRRRLTSIDGQALMCDRCEDRPPLKSSTLRRDQKILAFYGFQAPVMCRVSVLHRFLVDQLGLKQGARWTAAQTVEGMDLQVFLQTIGCGMQSGFIESALRGSAPMPRIGDLPKSVRESLVDRNYAGASRAVLAVRKLLNHLVSLGLAEAHTQTEPGNQASSYMLVHISYALCRVVEVHAMTASVKTEPPALVGTFDFATPLEVDRYWRVLQETSEAWMLQVRGAADASKDGAAESEGSDEEGDAARAAAPVPLPENSPMPELFVKKNWSQRTIFSPMQRCAIELFIKEMKCKAEESAPVCVLTPRSPEIVGLSRRLDLTPERIVKYCMQHTEIQDGCGVSGQTVVAYSLLSAWRFRCHICGYLCFQGSSIRDHYEKAHGSRPPDDEAIILKPDFQPSKCVERKVKRLPPPKHAAGLHRRRKRRARWGKTDQAQGEDLGPAASEAPEGEIPPVSDTDEEFMWLDAYVSADLLREQHRCPQGSSDVAPRPKEDVWPIMSELTGYDQKKCMAKLSMLREDRNNERYITDSRSGTKEARLPGGPDPNVADHRRAAGRALAKVLLLSHFRDEEPWWRPSYFTRGVHELIEIALQHLRSEGLVSRYKPASHMPKLPHGSRPSYMLTFRARRGLFGRIDDAIRWCEAHAYLAGIHGMVDATRFEDDSAGSTLMALADMLANDTAELDPVWEDEDFYEHAADKAPPWVAPAEGTDDESDGFPLDRDSDFRSEASSEDADASGTRYGGVQEHLKLTDDVPELVTVRLGAARRTDAGADAKLGSPRHTGAGPPGSADVPRLIAWLLAAADTVKDKSATKLFDPLGYCEPDSDAEAAQDAPEGAADGAEAKREPKEEAKEEEAEAAKAAEAGQRARGDAQISDRMARWCFDEYAGALSASLGLEIDAGELLGDARLLLAQVARGDVDDREANGPPGGAVGATVRVLSGEFAAKAGAGAGPRFDLALACLEELRLAVPILAGDDVYEVVGALAAPICIRRTAGPNPTDDGGAWLDAPDPLGMFSRLGVGRHWRCSAAPTPQWADTLRGAAACVARVGGGSMCVALKRWLLPPDFVSPAVWIDGSGHLNVQVFRCIVLNILQLLTSHPGLTCQDISDETEGILDACEVALVLNALICAGMASRRSDGPGDAGHLGASALGAQSPDVGGCVYFLQSNPLAHHAQAEGSAGAEA